MKTYIESRNTERAERLMAWAVRHSDKFLTGKPKRVLKYGVGVDNETTFVSFETERGLEDIFTGSDCLAASIEDSVKIVTIKES